MKLIFTLNGQDIVVDVAAETRLSHLLKEFYGIKSIGEMCLRGECGHCLVVEDGRLLPSCLIPAFAAKARQFTTAEGFFRTKTFKIVLKGFNDAGLGLCSSCAPVRVLAASALLEREEPPTEAVVDEIAGVVVCPCTGPTLLKKGIRLALRGMEKERRGG